jgi:hypothetical protein
MLCCLSDNPSCKVLRSDLCCLLSCFIWYLWRHAVANDSFWVTHWETSAFLISTQTPRIEAYTNFRKDKERVVKYLFLITIDQTESRDNWYWE